MDKKIWILDSDLSLAKAVHPPEVDLLIVSKNPKLYIPALSKAMKIGQIVFDGSVPAWKINLWKKDCDSLNIPRHFVHEKGAFVMNLR